MPLPVLHLEIQYHGDQYKRDAVGRDNWNIPHDDAVGEPERYADHEHYEHIPGYVAGVARLPCLYHLRQKRRSGERPCGQTEKGG